MQKIKDTIFETVDELVSLLGARVLEIGCGDGKRTIEIAARCVRVDAIDPDATTVAEAQRVSGRSNIVYAVAEAQSLPFDECAFDVVIFTLSLHHVPPELMARAISEAVRVVKPTGRIVFIEPTFTGSCFEAEVRFDAWDGDERRNKALAYATMLGHEGIKEEAERFSETAIQFESLDDFVASLNPQRALDDLPTFLERHNYTLTAERRINVFRLV